MATQFIYNSEDLIQQSADVKAYYNANKFLLLIYTAALEFQFY